MKLSKIIIITLCLAATITSCNNKDEEKPVITLSSPEDGSTYKQGETISFKATFTDNEALKQYRVDVHEAGDHTHAKPFGVSPSEQNTEWDEEIIQSISGTDVTDEKTINIPDDAETGEYDFLVECTDEAGNEAEFVWIEIHIESN